jgi:hypothetical protein
MKWTAGRRYVVNGFFYYIAILWIEGSGWFSDLGALAVLLLGSLVNTAVEERFFPLPKGSGFLWLGCQRIALTSARALSAMNPNT